ncbi:hypothetical protein TREMEDRAFT_58805 [Tremella mesenterica DSM 1558]|uniref:uncharacterized protein n=1 Tax=Tremella mesenterica (strain ATCC 24925 / CBS 8224 / DSM 1558 / NBRC 9311 / NRRL Y-6157 / RJB 2259-6 / UBC 559-6) TaxID=578456 RepID=UPI0003F49195|nr:uncharacterized protein TREMEDRAFT_58805 [Tremella mesenterica DSM 1558]EIW72635.1 hypothetical protein TREMEDRAFT_58805 [Tremella mesenterica DSM 1558]
MSQHNLALPTSTTYKLSPTRTPTPSHLQSSSGSTNLTGDTNTPITKKPIGKKRRRPRPTTLDQTRALDENDDVSDSEILAAPTSRRAVSEASDEEEDEEGEVEEVRDKGEVEEEEEGKGVVKRRRKRMMETNMLRGLMDSDQAKRYDTFYSVILPKQAVSRLNREFFDQHIKPSLSQIVAGLGKIYLAEIIELGRFLQTIKIHTPAHQCLTLNTKEVQAEQKATGALKPEHLRIAKERWEDTTGKTVKPSLKR